MTASKVYTLLFLRVSLGLLMLVWGIDKVVNPAHGVAVAERFYLGVGASAALMPALGIAQLALGAVVIVGALRRVTYPLLLAITGLTLLGVWGSVLDPWGWWLEGTNALFFPSLTVFAGALVLQAFRAEDRLVLARRESPIRAHPTAGV